MSRLGLPKRKEWPQCHKRAVSNHARAGFAKRKTNGAISPDHKIIRWERVKASESRILARVRRIRARAWEGKGGLHGKGRVGKQRELL